MQPESSNTQETSRKVQFYFEGKPLTGFEGESIAKALLRAGVRTLSYSVKYHRPRSVHCARGRCGMCHMEVNGVPGVPTCITPLLEGMRVAKEDFGPFYAPIVSRALNVLQLPAGFYYRFFNKPTFLRNMFLGRVRSMAGIGRVTQEKPEPLYRHDEDNIRLLSGTYDVIVVGTGLSGMAAALAAGKRGARVLLIDEYSDLGGHALGFQNDGELASERDRLIASVQNHPSLTICLRTTAQGFYPPDTLLIGNHSGMRLLRSKHFIFSTGAYDSVPLFENNDLPGIFGMRAVRLLIERDGLIPGRRAVLYGTGEKLANARTLLEAHGIEVALSADAGGTPYGKETTSARNGTVTGAKLVRAHGHEQLKAVTFSPRKGIGRKIKEACDLLCIAFSGQPAYELPYQAGFTFELSYSPIEEDCIMAPATNFISESGVSFYLTGEVEGQSGWRGKISRAQTVGERASAASAGKTP